MNKQQIKLFSSKKTDDWQTPLNLYQDLHKEFNFNFDPCPLNPRSDGLKIPWGERAFVNPPYSKIELFLKKAWEEIKKGNCKIAVFLTFANTDTKWFHNHIYKKAELRFIKGRVKFLNRDGKTKSSAMRPSMIAILK